MSFVLRGFAPALLAALALILPRVAVADEKPRGSERALMRLFIQDRDELTVMWTDVLATQPPTLSAPKPVEGFPKLDPDRQRFVQMAAAKGKVMVGVRDDEDGEYRSGWVLIDTGMEEEDHGDHSHWYYTTEPKVLGSQLDEDQGNPAHLYVYDDVFYLANDRIGGFTRLDPAAISPGVDESKLRSLAAFHKGGNGHITLAVAGDLAFSTWMSNDEENARRIDVTPVSDQGSDNVAFSFNANSGRLHGATAAQDKVFFAPAEGIDWIRVPESAKVSPKDIEVKHLDLGTTGETPNRTGSFVNHGRHVIFLTGRGDESYVGLIDAGAEQPEVVRVPLEVDPQSRASAPTVVQTRSHGPLLFVFHDHPEGIDAPNVADVIRLDPNRDGDWSDAEIMQRLEVGRSRVEGHSGHHDMAIDALSRTAVISNPGDSTVQVLSLSDLSFVAVEELPFVPATMVAVGGRGPIRSGD